MDVVLKVEGMSCGHCEKSVKDGLGKLNGVNNVEVQLEEGEVNVDYDQTVVSLEEICEQIEDLGYDVKK